MLRRSTQPSPSSPSAAAAEAEAARQRAKPRARGGPYDGSAQHRRGAHAQLSAPRTAAAQRPGATRQRRIGVASPCTAHAAAAEASDTHTAGRKGKKAPGGSGLRFESRLGTTQRVEGGKSAEGCKKKKAGQCGLEVSGCQPAPDNDHAHSSALHLKSTYFLQPSPSLAPPPHFSFLSRRPPGSRLQSRVQLA